MKSKSDFNTRERNKTMTPTEEAKKTVGLIFKALYAFPDDVSWREHVQGGYHAEAGITGGTLTAHVGYDGELHVTAGKRHGPPLITLVSGSCAQKNTAQDVSEGDSSAKSYSQVVNGHPNESAPDERDRSRR